MDIHLLSRSHAHDIPCLPASLAGGGTTQGSLGWDILHRHLVPLYILYAAGNRRVVTKL
jgi:hypothetical protein